MRYSILASVALAMSSSAAMAGDVQVLINRVPNTKGVVRIAIYPESTFLKSTTKPLQWLLKAIRGNLRHVFRGIPNGRYAIVAFHDQNNNGKLDFSSVGIPIEPLAFSNNAVGVGGPPKFSQAAITIGPRPISVTLTFD